MAEKKGGKAAAAGEDSESVVVEPEPGAVDQAVAGVGQAVEAAENKVDLSEEAHLRSIEQTEALAADADITARSLVWDLRDAMLEQFKRRPRTWDGLSQAEQRDVAAAFEHAAQEFTRKAVEAIRADGQTPVRVLLTKVTLGDDIVITGKVKPLSAEDEDVAVGLLHTARGHNVLLTLASKDHYQQEPREPETDADQRDLEFEAGGHPDDDSDLAGEDDEQSEHDQQRAEDAEQFEPQGDKQD